MALGSFFLGQEEAIVLANVASRAERYDDMAEHMKALKRLSKACEIGVRSG